MGDPSGFVLPWRAPLTEAVLLRRRHRFLADVRLADGTELTAHVPNSGSMEGLVCAGARVWLEPSRDPARRLPFTWVAVELDGLLIGVDTLRPNRLVRALLAEGALPALGPYDTVQPEFAHAPGSRVDFRLHTPAGPHDVEVKNCHLVYPDGRGYFPDSVSERATRHLVLLAEAARAGGLASVLFIAQREDATAIRPSDLHDPAFAQAARDAGRAGVGFLALRCRPTRQGLEVLGEVPVDLRPYKLVRHRSWREGNRGRSGWLRGPSPGGGG